MPPPQQPGNLGTVFAAANPTVVTGGNASGVPVHDFLELVAALPPFILRNGDFPQSEAGCSRFPVLVKNPGVDLFGSGGVLEPELLAGCGE